MAEKKPIVKIIENLIYLETQRQVILEELFHRIESMTEEEAFALLQELKSKHRGKRVWPALEARVNYLKEKTQLEDD